MHPLNRWKKRLLISLALLALLGVTLLITMELSLERGRVAVPNVVGMPAHLAMERLKVETLKGKIVGDNYHSSLSKGSVISQYPLAGSRIKGQGTVGLVISRGSNELFLPDFTNMPKVKARRLMGAKGLDLEKVSQVHSPTVPEDHVVAQSPQPGTKVQIGDAVSLLVSLGPEEVVFLMPDLIGREGRSTATALSAMGFEVQFNLPPPKTGGGWIQSQEPPAGSLVSQGAKILLGLGKEKPIRNGIRKR